MNSSTSSLELIMQRKSRGTKLAVVALCVVILGIVSLHTLLFITEQSISSAENKTQETLQKIGEIESNKDFSQYKRNKTFLSSFTSLRYSAYLSALYETTSKLAIIKSIQTENKTNTTSGVPTGLYITGEALPSLLSIKELLSSIESKSTLFSTPEVSALALAKNDTGKDSFTFPLTLTLKNGNHSAQTK